MIIVLRSKLTVECCRELAYWLTIYISIELGYLARVFFVIYFWKTSKDPTLAQTKFDLCFLAVVVIPELIWYLYGTAVLFGENVWHCRSDSDIEIEALWYSTLFIIVYGFFFWIFCIIVLFFGLFICCLYRK